MSVSVNDHRRIFLGVDSMRALNTRTAEMWDNLFCKLTKTFLSPTWQQGDGDPIDLEVQEGLDTLGAAGR